MNQFASTTSAAHCDPTVAAAMRRARRDPLFVLATRVRLVQAASFDEAWDKLERLKPGFYAPDAAWEAFMRSHWKEMAARAPKGAMRWTDRYLEALRAGLAPKRAVKQARVSMPIVRRERERDVAFAAACDGGGGEGQRDA